MSTELPYDVIIIGGGPAGLSAAVMLGRCRRRVLVCDAGRPRNAVSTGVRGFLSRDNAPPGELLRAGRQEARKYGVEVMATTVVAARKHARAFQVHLASGRRFLARKLLVATGVVDRLPAVDGIEACYGRSAFHCPYCDGWEVRDRRLAAYGRGKQAAILALALTRWSADIVLVTDGPARLAPEERRALAEARIPVDERRIRRLISRDGRLRRIEFAVGDALGRDALFFATAPELPALAATLGAELTRKGVIKTGNFGETRVPGLYAAGDASRDVQFVVVAAAEGAKAAYAINRALLAESGLAVRVRGG